MTEDDEAAFDEFLAARSTALLRTAILVCGASPHDAEDLVQNALEKVYRHWSRIRHDNPESYARRVVVNAAISVSRRRRVIREITFARPPETLIDSPDVELRDTLLAELRRLPARMRAVLVLRYWEDLSENETAAPAPPAAQPTGDAQATIAREVVVPVVTGANIEAATRKLAAAGLRAEVAGVEIGPDRTITEQSPAGGEQAPEGSVVTLTAVKTPDPTLNPQPGGGDSTPAPDPGGGEVSMPQDLGDLGDGREFGGLRIGYLPEGLVWGRWSVKDGFGATSYSTSWREKDLKPGLYSVQAIVYEGDAAAETGRRLKGYRQEGARTVELGDTKGYLVRMGEAGRVGDDDELGTPTIIWRERPGLAVEIMMSPDYSGKLGEKKTEAELRKIAESVVPTG
ncbi:sigma-70 family RNA polymerase sigma factor [Streptosporangium canum]|uniref:sigma-70 family RNA polymerase sigma factor n=1 Tax=Streptosporangium canum TaxID=324952 RepID=UPI0033B8487B